MPRAVESNVVKFRGPGKQQVRQIQPGSRKGTGIANPFRPTTLKMVEEWLEGQAVSVPIKEELIKMARQMPHGALDHFRNNIQTHIGVAAERVRQTEG